MTSVRSAVLVVITLVALVAGAARLGAQDSSPENHAKRILDLLRQQKYEDVAKEFDAQVAALMSPQRLEEVWKTVQGQTGEFKSIIDQKVQNAQGVTAVITGCEFANATVNVIVAFDSENKIAGLQIVPRQ